MSPRDPRTSWVTRVFRIDRGIRGVERDVDAELAFHLEMRARKLIAKGYTPDAARAAAVLQFGDYGGVRDECLTIDRDRERRMRLSDLWTNLRQDTRYAVRSLVEHRAFAIVVVLTLALGIGANTAIFSVVDALILRTLPVPHTEQLVTIGDPSATGTVAQGTERADLYSYPIYKDVRDHADVFSGMYAIGQAGSLDVLLRDNSTSGSDAVPEHPVGRLVTGNYFEVLQARARIGRTFTGAEDTGPGANPFVVLSNGYWQRRFAADPSVVGKQLSINGAVVTIVGVMPPNFTGDVIGGRADLWIPMMMQTSLTHTAWLTDRSTSWLLFMGRLAPGKSLAQARQSVRGLIEQSLRTNMSDSNWTRFERELRTKPVPVDAGARGFSSLRATFSQALVILMAAVIVVLLVVCANVANLMLARAASRTREISVRLALGASRARLVQQLLTESVLLSVVAAALGLAFATWGTRTLLSIAARGPNPIPLAAHVDARVLGYTMALTLITAVLFGLLPALRATRVEVASALRTQGRGATGALRGSTRGRSRFALAKLLVVAQVGLSALLLVGTGVLLRSMQRVASADLGLARDHLLVATVNGQHRGYEGARLLTLLTDLTARIERIPGVAAVSYSENGVFTGTESYTSVRIPGFEIRADSDKAVNSDVVAPRYFDAIGTSLIRGRSIEASDDERAAKVAVINQTMAKFYFRDADAVGRTLTRKDSAYTIIGVVRDAEEQSVGASPVRRVYFSIRQIASIPGTANFVIRTPGDPAALVKPVQSAITAADRALPVTVAPVNALVQSSVSQSILMTQVITFFGALTLLLAALGLYGVMAFTTARRTSEFGLRMALGASSGEVTRMVLREALTLSLVGLIIGVPAGIGAVRLIRSQLFEVGVFDPLTSALAVVVLAVVAVIAAGVPAMRAARVTPVESLRAD